MNDVGFRVRVYPAQSLADSHHFVVEFMTVDGKKPEFIATILHELVEVPRCPGEEVAALIWVRDLLGHAVTSVDDKVAKLSARSNRPANGLPRRASGSVTHEV